MIALVLVLQNWSTSILAFELSLEWIVDLLLFSIKLKAQFYNWTTSLFSHLPHVATNLSEENDNAVLWWGECHFTKRRIINCTREDAEGGRAIQETMFLKKKAPSWGRGNLCPYKFEAHFLRLSAHWCIDWSIDLLIIVQPQKRFEGTEFR